MNSKRIIEESLTSIPESEYGSDYRSHILEQYKLYLGFADKISERRQSANTFFLTANSAIVSAIGFSFSKEFASIRHYWFAIGGTLGILLCVSWAVLIRSYKQLNGAKFLVVHAIEARLPIRPYDAEWEVLGRGKVNKLYRPFAHIEQMIPVLFVVFYLVLGVLILAKA